MKTFFSDLFPRLRRFSEKLDNITLLQNQHWVVLDELGTSKHVYIFRSNSQLLISRNGLIEKGSWEYLGNNSLLIETSNGSYLFRHGFFDENILALKVDGSEEYAILINESKYGGDLNSLEKVSVFLENRYLGMFPATDKSKDKGTFPTGGGHLGTLDKDLNPRRNDSGKFGYLGKNGQVLIDFEYDGAYDFHEGLAMVYVSNSAADHYGFIDESGEVVINLIYEYAEEFSEGLALVRLRRKFGFIDRSGKIAIPISFDEADSFENGKAKVGTNGKKFFINALGKMM